MKNRAHKRRTWQFPFAVSPGREVIKSGQTLLALSRIQNHLGNYFLGRKWFWKLPPIVTATNCHSEPSLVLHLRCADLNINRGFFSLSHSHTPSLTLTQSLAHVLSPSFFSLPSYFLSKNFPLGSSEWMTSVVRPQRPRGRDPWRCWWWWCRC